MEPIFTNRTLKHALTGNVCLLTKAKNSLRIVLRLYSDVFFVFFYMNGPIYSQFWRLGNKFSPKLISFMLRICFMLKLLPDWVTPWYIIR